MQKIVQFENSVKILRLNSKGFSANKFNIPKSQNVGIKSSCYTLCEMLQNTSNLVLVIRKYFSFVQSEKCYDVTITASCRKDAVCCITTRSKRALHKDFCIIT